VFIINGENVDKYAWCLVNRSVYYFITNNSILLFKIRQPQSPSHYNIGSDTAEIVFMSVVNTIIYIKCAINRSCCVMLRLNLHWCSTRSTCSPTASDRWTGRRVQYSRRTFRARRRTVGRTVRFCTTNSTRLVFDYDVPEYSKRCNYVTGFSMCF